MVLFMVCPVGHPICHQYSYEIQDALAQNYPTAYLISCRPVTSKRTLFAKHPTGGTEIPPIIGERYRRHAIGPGNLHVTTKEDMAPY